MREKKNKFVEPLKRTYMVSFVISLLQFIPKCSLDSFTKERD
jgi:hypothetical protein